MSDDLYYTVVICVLSLHALNCSRFENPVFAFLFLPLAVVGQILSFLGECLLVVVDGISTVVHGADDEDENSS